MVQPDPNQWPIRISPDVLPPRFRGGVAPSRYEVALTTYIEKQAAHRESTKRELDIWRAASAFCGLITRGSFAAFRASLPALSGRPRNRVA